MKHPIYRFLAVAMLAASASLNTLAAPGPGEVDFGKFAEPGKDASCVEINVSHDLISLAAKLVEKPQPEAAKLLRSVQGVRVNVIGLTDENRDEMQKRVREIRSRLDKQGWARVVTAKEKSGEDTVVHVKTRGDEAVEGVAVTVLDGKDEAVLINIVGDIKPEQIAAVGEALNIEPLKKTGAAIKKESKTNTD